MCQTHVDTATVILNTMSACALWGRDTLPMIKLHTRDGASRIANINKEVKHTVLLTFENLPVAKLGANLHRVNR